MVYDLIIVGAGPIGLTCGIAAKKAGLDYLIIEKEALVNSIYHFPHLMTFFSTSKRLEIGGIPFISHTDKPTRQEALEYYRRVVEYWELNINYYEEVKDIKKDEDTYSISSQNKTYEAKNMVLATGFYDNPRLLGVTGENKPHVRHYYTDVHPYIGHKIVVVGAANSACDVALELFHKGCDVSMVIRSKEIYKGVKYWIRPNIENRIKEGSIKAYFESNVIEIKDKSVIIEDGNSNLMEVECDFVLAMTGYAPNFEFFEKIGLVRNPEDHNLIQYDSDTLETNLKGIYLAGVAVSGLYTSQLFIENTRHHADLIVNHITSK